MQHPAGPMLFLTSAVLAAEPAYSAPPAKVAPETPHVPSDAPGSRLSPAPDGFVEMFVAGVLPTEGGPAVVLRDKAEKTLLPIWIGTSEAPSIQLRLERRRFPRPLTHDLLDAIMHDLGGELLKIHVDDLKGDTFVGTVFVRRGDRVTHFDARPSDSIALAVGNGVPIFVSQAVIDRITSRREEVEKEPAKGEREGEPEAPEKARPPEGIQTL